MVAGHLAQLQRAIGQHGEPAFDSLVSEVAGGIGVAIGGEPYVLQDIGICGFSDGSLQAGITFSAGARDIRSLLFLSQLPLTPGLRWTAMTASSGRDPVLLDMRLPDSMESFGLFGNVAHLVTDVVIDEQDGEELLDARLVLARPVPHRSLFRVGVAAVGNQMGQFLVNDGDATFARLVVREGFDFLAVDLDEAVVSSSGARLHHPLAGYRAD